MFTVNPALVNENCSTKNEPTDVSVLIGSNEKNSKTIRCRRCQSLVFEANKATLLKGEERELREMSVGGAKGKLKEKIDLWWFTDNEFLFDTVGWQTVDGVKSLMCGDCEFGPFGWRTDDNKRFYIAAERMLYK
uniref:Guanine nucleotide exchange factor MSS4 n=1 Tax=Parascaris univalens TaxID=6257 RepID=A0A915AI86_PARUN